MIPKLKEGNRLWGGTESKRSLRKAVNKFLKGDFKGSDKIKKSEEITQQNCKVKV